MAADGISRLVMVTQMKTDQANDEALHGADKQRELVKQQKLVRDAQSKLDELARSGKALDATERGRVGTMFDNLNESGINVNKSALNDITGDGSTADADNSTHKANQEGIDGLKKELENAMKDLEALDRLGNFEIQRLMSQYNQSEQLASSVQKKKDDTANAVIGKVG